MQNAYKQLSLAAAGLNSASDELGQVIGVLDKALRKFNLGISAWVEVSGNNNCPPDGDRWFSRQIGYGKVGDKWGIALRTSEGDHRDASGDSDSIQEWLFHEAPRWMRIECVGKIPDLLERLVRQTEETTLSIKKKTAQAAEIAQAVQALADESQPRDQQ